MPLVLVWGLGALATGAGVKFLGDGIEDTAKASKDLMIVAAIGGGAYLIAKKQGLL